LSDIVLFDFDDHELRVVMIEGEPWFVAGDVCAILEIVKARDAVSRLDPEDAVTAGVPSAGGEQQTWVVNESGLFDLILDSRKPAAKRLRRKVTSEILPSIRKTGAYFEEMDLPTALEKYAATLRQQAIVERQAQEAKALVDEMHPKTVEYDYYMDAGESCSLGALGQALGAGRQRLIDRLRELKVLVSLGASQNGTRPMQTYLERKWFVMKMKDTPVGPRNDPYVTPRGVSGIFRLLVVNGTEGYKWAPLPSEMALFKKLEFGGDSE
jgi:prophage antirepressor-like protein